MGKEHTVPLSDQALAILGAQQAARGKNPFVFPGRPQKPLSSTAMSMLLRRMGVDATVHGFRSSFRMWAGDVPHIEFEVAEQCLAHSVGNSASQAYNRSDMLERRRPVMTAWAKFLSGEATPSNVVRIRGPYSAGAAAVGAAKGTRYAVVVGRGDLKGKVLSKHRSFEAAERAAQGANHRIIKLT